MDQVNLLVVDDDDVDRERIRRLLAQATFPVKITEAASGHDAIECVKTNAFDCIVLDYRLGDTTGIDLVSELKSGEDFKCPIVMVTGLGDERTAVEAMHEGVYDYLCKHQLQAKHLISAIEGGLHRAELERQLTEAQERLQRMSLYDSLTGLPNRNLFFNRLEQAVLSAKRTQEPFALLMMDLNLFKEVNDNMGHEAGDHLLTCVAQRLQEVVRKADTIARLGGDEFAAILVGTSTIDGAVIMANKIVAAFKEPIIIENQIVSIGISVGIALYPDHGSEGKILLANADQAMYRAKRSAQGFEVYAFHGSISDKNTFLISHHIPEAIDKNELFMLYQPKVHLMTGELEGVEALVRWSSPKFGLLFPDHFMLTAEKSAIVNPMGYHILHLTLQQMHEWSKEGINLPTSINLSARMFDDEQLAQRVIKTIAQYHVDPELVSLEITETALMASSQRTQSALYELRDAGIGVSIDDFGAGYTSLKYLRDFKITEIKIDKMFVRDLQKDTRDASIIRSITTLADGFDVTVVAEGVEKQDTWLVLEELGCHVGQGYSLGYPMSPDKLTSWVADNHISSSSLH